jgi:hypothetical protein
MSIRQSYNVALRLGLAVFFAGSTFAQNANNNANNNQQGAAAAAPAAATSAVITGVPTGTTAAPAAASTFTGISNLPSLAGATIPTAIVPFTQDAPFMQKSSVPEGTIFIAVGALLGFLFVSVLAWRIITFWLIHRSVKRANQRMGYGSDVKSGLTGGNRSSEAKKLQKYQSLAAPSTLSLDHLNFANPTGGSGAANKRNTSRQTFMSTTNGTRNSSLFFSPTAGAGVAAAGSHNSMVGAAVPGNRSSSYLPSGYYAAPGAAPGGGASSLQIGSGGGRQASGLARYSTYAGGSDPESPGLPPSRGTIGSGSVPPMPRLYTDGYESGSSRPSSGYGNSSSIQQRPSGSSLNMYMPGNQQPGGRVPSTNLDNFLEGGMFPGEARR